MFIRSFFFLSLIVPMGAVGQPVTGIPLDEFPDAMALNPAGPRLCSVGHNRGDISMIDTDTKAVMATIPCGLVLPTSSGGDMCVSPDRLRIDVADQTRNQMTPIDATTHRVIAGLAPGSWPPSPILTPEGRKLYVANNDYLNSGRLAVIDTGTLRVKMFSIGIQPTSIAKATAVHPNGSRVYVPGFGTGLVASDTSRDAVVATIPTTAWRVVLSPDGSRLYSIAIAIDHEPAYLELLRRNASRETYDWRLTEMLVRKTNTKYCDWISATLTLRKGAALSTIPVTNDEPNKLDENLLSVENSEANFATYSSVEASGFQEETISAQATKLGHLPGCTRTHPEPVPQ